MTRGKITGNATFRKLPALFCLAFLAIGPADQPFRLIAAERKAQNQKSLAGLPADSAAPSHAAKAPYPPSPIISEWIWAPKETIVRQAQGSDNWPTTWADDDALYTAYGDGWGFRPFVERKLSLGLAKIVGSPENFQAINLRSPTAEQLGNGAKGEKASGMLMIDGRLYMLIRNAKNSQLGWSDDHGRTWQWCPWKFTESFGCPTFLNFGKNYCGARDSYVYLYSQDSDSAYEPGSDRMVLARAPKDRLADRAGYEFLLRKATLKLAAEGAGATTNHRSAPGLSGGADSPVRQVSRGAAQLDSAASSPPLRVDLFAQREAWSPWTPREEIRPRLAMEPADGTAKLAGLVVSGGGSDDACGCWRRLLPPLSKGRRYRLEASFQQQGVVAPGHCIWALTMRGNQEYQELDLVESRAGRSRMAVEICPENDMRDASLGLFLAWSAEGSVRWIDAHITDITAEPVPRRVVRLAAVSGRPKNPKSVADCIDFYCQRLDEVGSQRVDLVCLPEVINADGLGDKGATLYEPIPGPSSDRLAEKAQRYKMYVAASLAEREGPRVYNTGVLLDRGGKILGKYRKTHLTIAEGLLSGKRPGEQYPVFDTDIGRIGYMICYDNHYPEVSRILAVKGAEIIVFSNMGDGREGGALWEPYMQTRALDNQVYIVASVNGGRSCIVSPRGEILSITAKKPGTVAVADCELGISVHDSTKREIAKRYLRVRRAETFEPLLRHYWQSKGLAAQQPEE